MLERTQGLTVAERAPGVVVHGYAAGRWYASRGQTLLVRDVGTAPQGGPLGSWQPLCSVPGPTWQRLAGRSRWTSLALRLGIHHVWPLPDGALLAISDRRVHRLEPDGTWRVALRFEGFRKPARRGVLVTRNPVQDSPSPGAGWHPSSVFLTEYTLATDGRRPVRVFRSDDGGRTFDVCFAFAPGQVRHVHLIQQDPFDGSLWLGTGDSDAESGLFRSTDNGTSWQEIGRGGQRWRTVGLAFRPDAIWWGTDAGLDAPKFRNEILRLDRKTGRLDTVQPVQGPVHAVGSTRQGDLLMATGIEDGANEADRRVHLWHGRDDGQFREIASWHRGLQPRQVQYAVCHLAAGQEDADEVWLTLRGVWGCPLGTLRVRLPQAA